MGKHPDFAEPLVSFLSGLTLEAALALVQIPLSLCQRTLSLSESFPEPTLTLTLRLESRERIGVLSSDRLGQGPNRLSQELPSPRSPDMSSEDKKQLRVPIKRLRELHERLSSGPLNLARLDPADLRSREAAPPRQTPHREARTHARLLGHLSQRLFVIRHRHPSLTTRVPSVNY